MRKDSFVSQNDPGRTGAPLGSRRGTRRCPLPSITTKGPLVSWLRLLRSPCGWLLCSLMGSAPALGQSAGVGVVVTGTVREADGAPIPGAAVSVVSDRGVAARTTTDAAGRYHLSLPHRWERCELRVERVGFYRFSAQLAFDDGTAGSVTRNVRLNPSTISLQALEVRSTRPAQRPAQGPTPGGNE